jgi:hypothetical protein
MKWASFFLNLLSFYLLLLLSISTCFASLIALNNEAPVVLKIQAEKDGENCIQD